MPFLYQFTFDFILFETERTGGIKLSVYTIMESSGKDFWMHSNASF